MTPSDHEFVSSRSTATPGELAFVEGLLERLRAGQDLRREKVRRLRKSIRANDYENSLKLDIAAERVADDVRISPFERATGELDGRKPI
jgi:hypothetical protein